MNEKAQDSGSAKALGTTWTKYFTLKLNKIINSISHGLN